MNINMIVKKAELTPSRAHPTDAGADLKTENKETIKPGETVMINTGVILEIPKGYCGMIVPRSGLGSKGIRLKSTVGIIDSDYRGELLVALENNGKQPVFIAENERVAQLLIIPVSFPTFVPVKKLSVTGRGTGGFGSTGTVEKPEDKKDDK